jgi:hypothetical protein
MTPLVVVTALAGTSLLLKGGYDRWKGAAIAPVRELTQGASYAVTAELTGIGSSDISAGAQYLMTFFQQAGFDVLSTPTPKDSGEATHYVRNEPSAWVFNGRWTKADKTVKQSAPNIKAVIFQPLPVS